MNFSLSEGIGFIGGWVLFGALMIAFSIVIMIVVGFVRGRNDDPSGEPNDDRASEDDYVL